MALEAPRLGRRGAVQAHDAPGQHVFFHHVGQAVGGVLALACQAAQAAAHGLHQQRHRGEQDAHEQRELPVQPHQVAQQCQQGERILQHDQHRAHQLQRAVLHLVDQGVGQAAGRMPREHRRLGGEHPLKQRLAQILHTAVGSPRQRILRDEAGQSAHRKHADDGHRHQPQRQRTGAEALVEQGLEHGGDQRLGERPHQRCDKGHAHRQPAVAEVRGDAGKALQQAGHGGGLRHGVPGRQWIIRSGGRAFGRAVAAGRQCCAVGQHLPVLAGACCNNCMNVQYWCEPVAAPVRRCRCPAGR